MFRQPMRMYSVVYFPILSLFMALAVGSGRAAEDSSQRTAPVSGDQSAEITLNVPLDAIVFIDGRRSPGGGMTRRFVTPPLVPGRRYFYDVKVTWINGYRAKELSRHLSFRAGDQVVLNYTEPNWKEFVRDLYMDPVAPAPRSTEYYEDILNRPYYLNGLKAFPGYRLYPW